MSSFVRRLVSLNENCDTTAPTGRRLRPAITVFRSFDALASGITGGGGEGTGVPTLAAELISSQKLCINHSCKKWTLQCITQ
jgi:hypothetical protein